MSAPQTHSDRGAAYTGLILGAIVLFVVLFSIVRLTHAHYAAEGAAPGAATTH